MDERSSNSPGWQMRALQDTSALWIGAEVIGYAGNPSVEGAALTLHIRLNDGQVMRLRGVPSTMVEIRWTSAVLHSPGPIHGELLGPGSLPN
jgi:hypothetical protein